MAAPHVVSVLPANGDRDVVLGTQITVVFDQEIDAATVDTGTFSVTGPGVQVSVPGELNAPVSGREYLTGTFSFSLDGQGRTVAQFNPSTPLRPNIEYTVLLLGGSNSLTSDAIKNHADEAMVDSYEWSFTTGALNVVLPPTPLATVPDQITFLDPKSIVVLPRKAVGNDLTQSIQLIFPDTIDPASVDTDALLVSLEPILGDLSVAVPDNLHVGAVVSGRTITITFQQV